MNISLIGLQSVAVIGRATLRSSADRSNRALALCGSSFDSVDNASASRAAAANAPSPNVPGVFCRPAEASVSGAGSKTRLPRASLARTRLTAPGEPRARPDPGSSAWPPNKHAGVYRIPIGSGPTTSRGTSELSGAERRRCVCPPGADVVGIRGPRRAATGPSLPRDRIPLEARCGGASSRAERSESRT
jgi:hypothetical protein